MALLQAAFRLLAVRDLPVSQYGRVALLISLFNALVLVGHFGVPVAAARIAARTCGSRRDRDLLRSCTHAILAPCGMASFAVAVATMLVTASWSLAVIAALGTPPMILSIVASGFLRGKGSIWSAASIQPANTGAQLAVLVLVGLHGGIGVWSVLTSFYLGNVAALVIAGACLSIRLRHDSVADDPPDSEARPTEILRFGGWLTASSLCLVGLATAPRIALAHLSYEQVAFFDIALLLYTIPQRLTASFVTALIPHAAVVQRRRERVVAPSKTDIVFLAAGFAALDLILWATHALAKALILVGLDRYVSIEPLLLIFVLGAPAEFLFAFNAGLLQAFGRSKTLARSTFLVLGVSIAATGPVVILGPRYLAALLVVAYWVLYLLSHSMLATNEVQEQALRLSMLRTRPRQRVA